MRIRRLLIVSFITLLCVTSGAQKPVDGEVWAGASYALNINKKFKVSLEEEFRFNTTAQYLRTTITEVRLRYKINKDFSVKGNYRISAVPYDENALRWSLAGYY